MIFERNASSREKGEKSKVPEKSSRKAALEKLSRSHLIEIIFTLQQHERNLVKERDSLKQLLASQGSAGSGATSVPGIVEHAQQAAEKCLESLRDMNEKAQEANNQDHNHSTSRK